LRIIRRRRSLEELVQVKQIKQPVLAAGKDSRKIQQIDGSKLETLYKVDGLTFREVNDYIDFILGEGFYFEGDEELCKLAEEWAEDVKLKRVLEAVLRDIFVGGVGNAYVELGYSSDGKDIVELKVLDPSKVSYIKDPLTREVQLDEEYKPVGFQYKDRDLVVEWRKDVITRNGKEIWKATLPDEDGRDRIAHFTLFTLGSSYTGITPLEAVYKQALIRLNLEEAVGEGAFRSGSLIAYVGSEQMPRPSPELIDKIVSDLQNVSIESVFGFPIDVKIERMPAPDFSGTEGLILYFAAIQSLGMGIPPSRHFLPGIRVPARASESSDLDFERRIAALQDRLAEQIREKLLYRLFKARGLVKSYKEVPKVVFRSKSHATLETTINLLSRLGRRDLIRRDPELELKIRRELGLPTKFVMRELERWNADTEKIPERSKPRSEVNIDEDSVREVFQELNEEEEE